MNSAGVFRVTSFAVARKWMAMHTPVSTSATAGIKELWRTASECVDAFRCVGSTSNFMANIRRRPATGMMETMMEMKSDASLSVPGVVAALEDTLAESTHPDKAWRLEFQAL